MNNINIDSKLFVIIILVSVFLILLAKVTMSIIMTILKFYQRSLVLRYHSDLYDTVPYHLIIELQNI